MEKGVQQGRAGERTEASERRRTLSVDIHPDLARHMIDYCKRSGMNMSTAVSDALATFLREEQPAE